MLKDITLHLTIGDLYIKGRQIKQKQDNEFKNVRFRLCILVAHTFFHINKNELLIGEFTVLHNFNSLCFFQNIVLRHLNILLGYNQTEKSFTVPPHKLRFVH